MLHIGEAAIAYTPPAATLPLVIDLPLPEPYEEPYLEVRLAPDGEVVTMIEPLSHTNKRAGDERHSYPEKRAALIDSTVHFVEIDLLRAHEPLPFARARTTASSSTGASWDGGRTSIRLCCANRSPASHCRCCRTIQSRGSTSASLCMPCTTALAISL